MARAFINLPASIRDPILKALGESGNDVGLLPRGMFSDLRAGSLRFDKMEAKKKAEFLRQLIAAIAGYMALYHLLTEKVAFAEIQVERILKSLDEGITILQKNRKNSFDPEANPKHIIPVAKKQKQEIIDFRDNQLKTFKERLQSQDLPNERELVDMQKTIDKKMTRFQKFKDVMARKLIDVARYGFEVIADMSAASFAEIKKAMRLKKHASEFSEEGHIEFNEQSRRKKAAPPLRETSLEPEDVRTKLDLDDLFPDAAKPRGGDHDPVAD